MSTSTLKQHLEYIAFGLLMGVTLTGTGFTDFTKVHKMFTFQNFTLLLVFAGAVVLNGVGFAILTRHKEVAKKKFNKGTIPGSIVFGIGWALTGACPAVALAQVGDGQLAALATLSGIVFGVWYYRRKAAGAMQLDTGICGEGG